MADSDLPAGFSATPPKLTGLDAIRGYFKDKGNFLNPNAADALAATSFAETGGDPYAVNKSNKAAGAFQWLGPRKEAFVAAGDTSPEGMAKFAMSELPRYPRSWQALNDPNVSRDELQRTLIDDFERPGPEGAAGDLSRARAYVPPKAGDVQKSDLPPPKPKIDASNFRQALDSGQLDAPGFGVNARQGLPPGFSAAPPPKNNLPPGFSSQAPGAVDPEIAARTKPPEDTSYFAPEKKVAKMLMADPTGTLKKLGAGVVQMGKGALNDLAVFGDVAKGKASTADPATQERVMGAAMLTGGKEAPGKLGAAGRVAEALPVAKTAEVPAELPKAIGDPRVTPTLQIKPAKPTPPANDSHANDPGKPWEKTDAEGYFGEGEKPPRAFATQQMEDEAVDKIIADIKARKLVPKPGSALGSSVTVAPKEAGAAATPLHEIAAQNIRDFEAATKAPSMKERFVAGKEYAKGYFSKAEEAKASIQKNAGNMNRMAAQAREAMVPFQKFTRSLNPEEGISMLEWLETPEQKAVKGLQLEPEAQGFADTFKNWMQSYRKKIASLPGKDQMQFRDDFVTHLYRDAGDAQKAIQEYGAKQGSGYFTKGRVFDTYADAIHSGKPLLTTDPMEIFSRYIENASKKIASWESIEDAKAAGNLVYRKPSNAPVGWLSLKGVKDGLGHDAYAPPGYAQVYNNWTSRAAEFHIPGTQFDVLDNAQRASNFVTGVKLTLSLFHPALVTGESIMSGMANGITKLKNGRPIAGIAEMAKSPIRPLTSFAKGRQAQKAYLDGEFGSVETQRLIQALTDADYDFMREGGLANEYRVSRLPGFIKGWQKGIPAGTGGPLRMGLRAFESVMEPTFQYYVPWLKNQAVMARMKTFLDAHPNAAREELATYARKVGGEQDARMGEMNTDNLFWHNTAKKMARVAALSWSFTLGQAQNALGATWDAARVPDRTYRAIKGTKPDLEEIWTDRMSYAVAVPLTIALADSFYQYSLGSGDAPQSLADLMNPRTGGTDPSTGQPERATLPSFANAYKNIWEGGFGQEMFNKVAPLWQTIYNVAKNEDYRHLHIRNLNDTGAHQLAQIGEYVGSNMATPISIGQVGTAKAGSHINSLERMFGIKAAGMRDTAPEQLKQIMSYKQAEAWYETRRSDINQKRGQNGLGPLRIPHRERTHLIEMYMKNPQVDPLQKYGGTQ